MPKPPESPRSPSDLACDLCGDQGPLLLRPKCHLTAPLAVELDGDQLILRCYVPECSREVARFTVVRDGASPAIDVEKVMRLVERYAIDHAYAAYAAKGEEQRKATSKLADETYKQIRAALSPKP